MAKEAPKDAVPAMVEGLVAALVDHHGQMDIRLQKVHVGMPGTRWGSKWTGRSRCRCISAASRPRRSALTSRRTSPPSGA